LELGSNGYVLFAPLEGEEGRYNHEQKEEKSRGMEIDGF